MKSQDEVEAAPTVPEGEAVDLGHAEWYAWAKREISADDLTCHGVAVAVRATGKVGSPPLPSLLRASPPPLV
ncbi:MAG: hypothetical protein ACREN8_13700, partial [Candidatus Dormibacteraceae bacterium]